MKKEYTFWILAGLTLIIGIVDLVRYSFSDFLTLEGIIALILVLFPIVNAIVMTFSQAVKSFYERYDWAYLSFSQVIYLYSVFNVISFLHKSNSMVYVLSNLVILVVIEIGLYYFNQKHVNKTKKRS